MATTRQSRTTSIDVGGGSNSSNTNSSSTTANTSSSTGSTSSSTPSTPPIDPFSLSSLAKIDRKKIVFINILHSDGQTEVPNPDEPGKNSSNRPPAHLIKTNKEEAAAAELSAWYKACPKDGRRDLQWRVELGTLLVAAMNPTGWGEKLHCLKSWPEGYVLYDRHVQKADKTTILTYLYGHPGGPKMRYKNPQEFLPHLMWLAADKEHKKGNCACIHCKGTGELDKRPPTPPPEPVTVEPSPVPATAKAPTTRRRAAAKPATATANTTTGAKAKGKVGTASKSPAPQTPTPTPVPQPQPQSHPPSQPQHPPVPQQFVPVPTPPPYPIQILLSAPSTQERSYDLQYTPDIYRRGECVWFQASAGDRSNWSLGVILGKEAQGNGYSIQILSSPLSQPSPHVHVTHDRIRPWLAWTAPAPQQPDLRQPGIRFENVNWENYRFEPNLEVDASIVIAKQSEGTYCPVDLLPIQHPNERYYSGLWFGAEKIWVGEGVRLKRRFSAPPPPPTQKNQIVILRDEVLVVSNIFERVGPPPIAGPGPALSNIYLTGDIFLLQPSHVPPGTNINQLVPPPTYLPDRMRKDAQARNTVSIEYNLYSSWQLVVTGVTVPMEELKGRWYESSILMKHLLPGGEEQYLHALRQGGLTDLGSLLNQMGGQDGLGIVTGRGWERVPNRESSFKGGVVKNRLTLIDNWPRQVGMVPQVGVGQVPMDQQQFLRQQQQQAQQLQLQRQQMLAVQQGGIPPSVPQHHPQPQQPQQQQYLLQQQQAAAAQQQLLLQQQQQLHQQHLLQQQQQQHSQPQPPPPHTPSPHPHQPHHPLPQQQPQPQQLPHRPPSQPQQPQPQHHPHQPPIFQQEQFHNIINLDDAEDSIVVAQPPPQQHPHHPQPQQQHHPHHQYLPQHHPQQHPHLPPQAQPQAQSQPQQHHLHSQAQAQPQQRTHTPQSTASSSSSSSSTTSSSKSSTHPPTTTTTSKATSSTTGAGRARSPIIDIAYNHNRTPDHTGMPSVGTSPGIGGSGPVEGGGAAGVGEAGATDHTAASQEGDDGFFDHLQNDMNSYLQSEGDDGGFFVL